MPVLSFFYRKVSQSAHDGSRALQLSQIKSRHIHDAVTVRLARLRNQLLQPEPDRMPTFAVSNRRVPDDLSISARSAAPFLVLLG
jgi:hypothetical protein